MQLGVLNMLLGISNGAANGGAGQGQGGGAATGIFAQLLNDGSSQGGQQAPLGGQLLGDVAPSALVAQEVGADATAKLETLQDLLGKEISADDARAMLEQLDAQGGELGEGAPEGMLQDLKAVLTAIKDSKTPQTVGAVLGQMASLHAAPVERAPAVERMLAWMKHTLTTKSKDALSQDVAVEDAEGNSASPIVQSLQASMFRDADTAAQAQAEEAARRDYVEIVPLNVAVETAAPAWIKHITAHATREGIDNEIPDLKLAADDTLPQVNLPGMGEKVTDMAQFRAMMENQVAQQSTAPDDHNITNPAPSVGAAQAAVEHRNAMTLAATHAVMNHAPVLEQVHVAIRRASKDGIDQLTIQLEPADLGRVEVSMRTGADGHTQLSFLVDKSDTLDALARDARSLERALQEAGVKADSGSMQFNLRQQHSQQAMGDGQGHHQPGWGNKTEEVVGPQAAAAVTQNYTLTLRDGVDIRA